MGFLGNIFKRSQTAQPVSAEFQGKRSEIEQTLGYKFKEPHLLERALTHSSFASQNNIEYSYERLEFLGDAVLQLVVTAYLFKKHAHLNEGTLTKYRTILEL